jgi:hypothetical protein
MKTIVASDAGAAEILSFFVKKKKYEYNYLLKGSAKKIFKKNLGKFNTISLKDSLKKTTLYICGTGWQSDIHIQVIKAARSKDIKVIAYLDHWTNYKNRFFKNNEYYFPDEIWVGDEKAYKIAKKTFNIKVKKINNYYLDYIKKEFEYKFTKNKKLLKKTNILYVTEPTSKVKNNQWKLNKYDYDEFSSLIFFLNKIKFIYKDFKIRLKTHPAENPKKYNYILKKYNYNIQINKTSNLINEIKNSEVVVGCNTLALYLAIVAKKNVLCSIPTKQRSLLPFKQIKYLRNLV